MTYFCLKASAGLVDKGFIKIIVLKMKIWTFYF